MLEQPKAIRLADTLHTFSAVSAPLFAQTCATLVSDKDIMKFCPCTYRARIYLRKARVLRMGALFDIFAAFLFRLVSSVPAAAL